MPGKSLKAARQKLQSALAELLAENAYERLSVALLCRTAGISRSTFYEYYEDLENLLDEIEDEFLSHIPFWDCRDRERDVQGAMLDYVNYARENVEMLEILTKCRRFTDPLAEQALIEARRFNHRRLIEGTEAEESLLVAYTVAGSISLIQEWLFRNPDYPPEKIAKILICFSQSARHLMGHR